ncbi:MAG: Holliday junction branch migration protein RuvA, partial [Candidatus Caldatribacteriaceae bacterium]
VVETMGMGFRLRLTPFATPQKGEEASFLVRSFLRESGEFVLYGFSEGKERMVFDRLREVRGINHRTAFKILSRIPWEELVGLILDEDLALLEAKGGLGAKTAKRLILELKPVLLKTGFQVLPPFPEVFEETKEVLYRLGYNRKEVEKVVNLLWDELRGEQVDVEFLIRKALSKLGGSD